MSKIIVRENPLSQKQKVVIIQDGSTLEDAYNKYRQESNLHSKGDYDQYFKIYVNGHEIYRKYWKHSRPRPGMSILIAIVPRGGDFGQIAKQVLILTAVVVASFVIPGGGAASSGLATVGHGLAVAAVGVGSTLILNALIPPPSNALRLNGSGGDDYSDSQMYTISSQSNSVEKFKSVMKVYGQHRVFPNVAANAYTTIEADPNSGELVQYFYAIYDFGLGPLEIEEIKIGDTLIRDYTDLSYKLVDLNKPGTDEGTWDEQTQNFFEFYKGDVTQTNVQVPLNDNESDGGTVSGYQLTRSAATNTRSENQEITATFVFPSGLVTLGTDGSREGRNVDIRLEFAEEGTEDWREFDDLTYVDDYEKPLVNFTPINYPSDIADDASAAAEFELFRGEIVYNHHRDTYGFGLDFTRPEGDSYPQSSYYRYHYKLYGIKKGVTTRVPIDTELSVGTDLYAHGVKLGKVLSTTVRPSGGWWHDISAAQETVSFGVNVRREKLNVAATAPDTSSFRLIGDAITRKEPTAGVNTYNGIQTTPLYGTFLFKPKSTASLKIRMTRVRSFGGLTFQIVDDMTWVSLTTRFDADPIVTNKRHTFFEVRIKATDQLNGAIQNLSATATSVLDVYDGTTWTKQATSNPAWIFSDLITGEINKNALAKTRLDTTSLLEWAGYADEIPIAPPNVEAYTEPRFSINFILDYSIILSAALNQVANAAQASLNIIDGKYGVLLDKAKTTPVQVFTPRNSFGFSSSRKYTEIPDGLKIKYVDTSSNWEIRERVVYNDGFNATTAEKFEEFDGFGILQQEQAYRYGRYLLAQAKLRQETISLTVDFEHLVCTRGDYVIITQDAMKVGGIPFRVKAVSGSVITIDAPFATQPATSYGYTYRSVVDGIVTSTMTVNSSTTATLNGSVPSVGDIIIWGEVNLINYDCIVKSISPNSDLTASVSLVEKNDAIFLAESSENIPDYSPQISTVQDESLSPPAEVVNLSIDENSYDCNGGQYLYFIDLSWEIPVGATYEVFEVYVDYGKGYELVDFVNTIEYRYVVSEDNLGSVHNFKVLAVSATGSKLSLGEVSLVSGTPVSKTTAPSDVSSLFINVTNETLQLDWPLVSDCDIDRYLIRFSPSLTAEWESSTPLLETDANTSLTNVQARTGSYFVKARDWNGNDSALVAKAVTSIPNLFNLNVIEETNDFPTFPGVMDRVVTIANDLLLDIQAAGATATEAFYSEGFYYYDSFLDLGGVYSVRLQSLIEAEGYTNGDLMVNWTTLSDVALLSSSQVSDWGVETYYRGRDTAVTMANWTTLAIIDPISQGEQGEWTDWRKFTIGDFTARIFQFRLKLISNQASVSPRVFEAKIKSDMPDRIASFDNIVAPISGYSIVYSPAFKGPGTTPAIQITQDNAQSGDYYIISNKTLDGFDIIFYDKTDTAVSRQFDAFIKGFGFEYTATI